jgi:hypothetical protein
MYENAKILPVKTAPRIRGGRMKESRGRGVGNSQDPQSLLEKSRVTEAFVQQP